MAEFNIFVKKEDGTSELVTFKNVESLSIQKNVLPEKKGAELPKLMVVKPL